MPRDISIWTMLAVSNWRLLHAHSLHSHQASLSSKLMLELAAGSSTANLTCPMCRTTTGHPDHKTPASRFYYKVRRCSRSCHYFDCQSSMSKWHSQRRSLASRTSFPAATKTMNSSTRKCNLLRCRN